MMARAPGKVVLSGAYAVLDGAPALVAAVDRYVVADTSREADRVTPEVAEALGRDARGAPWFDASQLRDKTRNRKLGLGSSAAILVASLAALELAKEPETSDEELAERIFFPALGAHQRAQGGGSGVDVAASTFGGILRFERKARDARPDLKKITLPHDLFIQVWSSDAAASTADMLARVAAFRARAPNDHRVLLQRLGDAAATAAQATSGAAFVAACRDQLDLLSALGDRAGAPIVTPEVRAVGRALGDRAVVLPSGAGGGDVVLVLGTEMPGEDVGKTGPSLGFLPLSVTIGAKGVHAAPGAWQEAERNAVVP